MTSGNESQGVLDDGVVDRRITDSLSPRIRYRPSTAIAPIQPKGTRNHAIASVQRVDTKRDSLPLSSLGLHAPFRPEACTFDRPSPTT